MDYQNEYFGHTEERQKVSFDLPKNTYNCFKLLCKSFNTTMSEELSRYCEEVVNENHSWIQTIVSFMKLVSEAKANFAWDIKPQEDDVAETAVDKNDSDARARAIRNAYAREWRSKNQARTKEYNKRYWEKRAFETMKKDGDAT